MGHDGERGIANLGLEAKPWLGCDREANWSWRHVEIGE